jgi:UDP-N-acetylglucosamine:LPS N-acetylglucosamine transferase
MTVVTDLATVHRFWFSRAVDACLVPNHIVRDLALSYGLTEEQVIVTGIPVNPELVRDQRSPATLRRELGWEERITTFLAVGSRRVDRLVDTLNILNHFGQPFQVAVVTGKDQDLYTDLKRMDWHIPAHIYEFVDNVPTMMRAADAVICKAGGLVITEALAAGKPLLLVDAIPGQETGNADLVVRGGAGELARSDIEVLETVAHWFMHGGKLLEERSQNAKAMGRPQAAYDVADQVYRAAQRGPAQHRHMLNRRSLIDLFNRNQVRWGDTKDLKG